MAELKLAIQDVEALISGVKGQANQIKTSTSSVPQISKCSGIMVSAYRDRIIKIGKLMEQYKKLLEKDMKDITYSMNMITQLDRQIAGDIASSPTGGYGGGGGGGGSR